MTVITTGHKVPPLSRKQIRKFTDNIRQALQVHTPHFPIVKVYEFVLPKLLPEFEFHCCTYEEMGEDHGRTWPDKQLIKIRQDVYDGACDGNGRDRFTLAHEFGHLVIHQGVSFGRTKPGEIIPPYRESEWQANCFGGELLMSYRHLDGCRSPYDMVEKFKVTFDAAQTQWIAFKNHGLLRL
jgi:Zn-dependent peptidase ImmA (M78 family)